MDRFSEDEARRIFAEAAQAQTPGDADGLSLAELQEIGRAAGLDPAAIAAAAATVRDPAPATPMWRGVPLATRRTRIVPGPLTDDDWARAVADFRHTFKVHGVTEQIGGRRTWTHVVGESVQVLIVRVTAEPAGSGTRVTVESGEQSDGAAANVLSGIFAACGAALGVALGFQEGAVAGLLLAGAFLAVAAAFYIAIRWSAARRARQEPVRFDAVLDRVARLATAGAASAEAPAETDELSLRPAVGLLDLDDPLSADDGSTRTGPRRTRS